MSMIIDTLLKIVAFDPAVGMISPAQAVLSDHFLTVLWSGLYPDTAQLEQAIAYTSST